VTGTLNYDVEGSTQPSQHRWSPTAAGYRHYERTVRIGHGDVQWECAAAEVLQWGIKTRSGFKVDSTDHGDVAVRENVEYTLTARVGPISVREPVRVVALVREPDRCGFAYGTIEGHPVSGEEAFIVHRTSDGAVWLTLRSLTRPARGVWGLAFPVLLIAQRLYRRRYLRALLPAH
jgi:uncharacterized protein (UPF0548 family)